MVCLLCSPSQSLLQNLAKAQEEAIAPQRKKARNAQHQTEAETGSVSEDSQFQGQHRSDMEEEATAVAAPPATLAAFEHPHGWEQWSMAKRRTYKQRQQDKQRKEEQGWGGQGRLG